MHHTSVKPIKIGEKLEDINDTMACLTKRFIMKECDDMFMFLVVT